MVAKTEQHINNVHYTIEKQQDKTHFYKTITVDDTIQKIQKSYTEKVAKFYIKDFEQMLAQQGLQIKYTFGDYNLSTYDTQQSSRMIMIAVKGV